MTTPIQAAVAAASLAALLQAPFAASNPAHAQETAMTEQTQSTEEVVKAFGEAQSSGDFDALLGMFAEDAQWRVDGDADVPWVGDHRGPEAIGRFLQTFGENITIEQAENLSQTIAGENAFQVNRMVLTVKKTGQTIESNSVIHFEVQDGLITKHNVYEDTYAVSQAWQGGS